MLIPAGFGQVNFVFSGEACPSGAQVTFGIGLADDGDSFDTVAGFIVDALDAVNFESVIENDSQLDGFLLKLGPNDDGPSGFVGHVLTGDAGSDGTVPNVAALVRKNTNTGGRQGRGRLYWPFVMATWVDDGGNLSAGPRTEITTQWNTFREQLEGNAMEIALLHAESSPSKPVHKVEFFSTDGKVATQRRRLRR